MCAPKDAKASEVAIDPLASPPQDAVDAHGNVLDANEISSLSLEGGSETHSLFSQKNLLRLAALTNSQRTLSLFTPSIREAVFRAWARHERDESNGPSSAVAPTPSRTNSTLGTGTTYTFSDNGSEGSTPSTRPNLHSYPSTTGLSLGAGRNPRSHGKKKKNRIVNLRKKKTSDDSVSESGESSIMTDDSSYVSGSMSFDVPRSIPEEPDEDVITPPRSPPSRVRFARTREDSIDLGETPRTMDPSFVHQNSSMPLKTSIQEAAQKLSAAPSGLEANFSRDNRPRLEANAGNVSQPTYPAEKVSTAPPSVPYHYTPASAYADPQTHGGSILEQAWMMKMASELARRAQAQKAGAFWDSASRSDKDDIPPPAYEAQ